MRRNPVKAKLAAGEVVLGTMVFEFKTNGIARLAANAGAEFVIYDTEHTGWTWETVNTLMATARGTDAVPMVRVPTTQRSYLSRPLDAGAMGLMIPMVETAAQAEKIVEWSKYPPDGTRGAAFAIAHDDFLAGDNVEKMRSANTETLLIGQIETVEGVKNLDAIAEVGGLDVLWVGHFDLTNSMGIPGEFEDPEFLKVLDRVAEAADRNGKASGFMVSSVEEAQRMIDRGYRCLAYGGDLWIYGEALRSALTSVRDVVAAEAVERDGR